MKFDRDMSYWKALRVIAVGLVKGQGLSRAELEDLWAGLKMVLLLFARLGALALLPIIAPLFAYLIQRIRKKEAARLDRMAEEQANGSG